MDGPPLRGPAARASGQRPGWARGCLFLVLVTVSLLALLAVASWMLRREGPGSVPLAMGSAVGLIRLEGEIWDSDEFKDELDRLAEDRRVKALVVRIDSPGGGVAPSQQMYEAIRRFRESRKIPVVASLGSLAASGGYYVACGTQGIMAEPGTLTGSIGVIFSFLDARGLMEKLGLRMEAIKSGDRKDFGAYWRSLSPEERAMLESIVADVQEQFVGTVARSRGMGLGEVRELADGRIFTGRQALEVGLVDTLGFREDAQAWAARLAGLPADVPVISKERYYPFWLSTLRRLGEGIHLAAKPAPRLEYR